MSNKEFTIDNVKESVLNEISINKRFLFNELELQMLVAHRLEKDFKADDGYIVHLEYRLPKGWNNKFDEAYTPWGETPYFDIVLEHVEEGKSQYIGIELKYKLKEVNLKAEETAFKRFGTLPSRQPETKANKNGIKLVSNQAAENEGRYDFWKDVKRLELLAQHFNESVIGGIAIFLTNQSSYYSKKDNTNYKYSAFNFTYKERGKPLNWNHKAKSATDADGNLVIPKWCKMSNSPCLSCKSPCGEDKKESMAPDKCKEFSHFKRPNFKFNRDYEIFWYGKEGCLTERPLGQTFYCCYVTIPKWQAKDE